MNIVVMHQVKQIRKGEVKGFTKFIKQLYRKQIPVCQNCNNNIQSGKFEGIVKNKLN
jgi:hypothetical protein